MQNHQKDVFSQPEKLAQDLLKAVRFGQDSIFIQTQLSEISPQNLESALQSDAQKVAFWVNIYNAYIQIVLKQKPHLARDKTAFFTKPQLNIAGQPLSFDTIEHGILRKSKMKYGLGYLPKYLISNFERTHRVSRVDARLHFALNCAAASCPPIAFYHSAKLQEQLDMAAHNYLEQHTKYDAAKNLVGVTRLVFWFKGDFRGKYSILALLKKYQIIPQDANPRIKYLPYDWQIELDNYLGEYSDMD